MSEQLYQTGVPHYSLDNFILTTARVRPLPDATDSRVPHPRAHLIGRSLGDRTLLRPLYPCVASAKVGHSVRTSSCTISAVLRAPPRSPRPSSKPLSRTGNPHPQTIFHAFTQQNRMSSPQPHQKTNNSNPINKIKLSSKVVFSYGQSCIIELEIKESPGTRRGFFCPTHKNAPVSRLLARI